MKLNGKCKIGVRVMNNDTRVTAGSGNVFADLGLPNAGEHDFKAGIVLLIGRAIKERGLTQTEAAKLMGLSQPDVSKMLRGRFEGFSLERLISLLLSLGQNIDVQVGAANENEPRGRIRLFACEA